MLYVIEKNYLIKRKKLQIHLPLWMEIGERGQWNGGFYKFMWELASYFFKEQKYTEIKRFG